jgi:hypothetical protein
MTVPTLVVQLGSNIQKAGATSTADGKNKWATNVSLNKKLDEAIGYSVQLTDKGDEIMVRLVE